MTAPTAIHTLTRQSPPASREVERATMRERVPGQTAIEQVIGARGVRRVRSAPARWLGRSPLDLAAREQLTAALGERATAGVLAGLPDGWVVLHSLPAGRVGSDIDHLVVGPAGVFVISTATRRLPSVLRAEAGARRVERLLTGLLPDGQRVLPIVAVVGGLVAVRSRLGAARVLRSEQLTRVLLRLPRSLGRDDVRRIAAVVERPDSWHPAGVAEPDLLLRFAALHREVRTACRIRATWSVSAAVTVAAVLAAGGVLLH